PRATRRECRVRKLFKRMVRPERFELPTPCFVVNRVQFDVPLPGAIECQSSHRLTACWATQNTSVALHIPVSIWLVCVDIRVDARCVSLLARPSGCSVPELVAAPVWRQEGPPPCAWPPA